jgi:hypothetical protein
MATEDKTVDQMDEEAIKLISADIKASKDEAEGGEAEPKVEIEVETEGGDDAKPADAAPSVNENKDDRIAKLEKMLEELTGHVKSQGRTPEHSAFATAYPHLSDKYSELSEKAVKFADDAVGRESENWGKIADKYLRSMADGMKAEDAKPAAKGENKGELVKSGAKKPEGVAPVSKPKPAQKANKNLLSEEEEIALLTPKSY